MLIFGHAAREIGSAISEIGPTHGQTEYGATRPSVWKAGAPALCAKAMVRVSRRVCDRRFGRRYSFPDDASSPTREGRGLPPLMESAARRYTADRKSTRLNS